MNNNVQRIVHLPHKRPEPTATGALGTTDYLAYGPTTENWDLDAVDSSTIKYNASFTWNDLLFCTDYDGNDLIDITTDETWINMTGRIYIAVVSPFTNETVSTYNSADLHVEPFKITVRRTPAILNNFGVSIFILNIFQTSRVFARNDYNYGGYTIIVSTQTADYFTLNTFNLLAEPGVYDWEISEITNSDSCYVTMKGECIQFCIGYDGINSSVRQQMIVNDNINGLNTLNNDNYKQSSGLSAWLATGNLSDLNVNHKEFDTEFQLTQNSFAMFGPSPNVNEYTLLFIYNNLYNNKNYSKVNRYWEINENKQQILEWLKNNKFDDKFTNYTNYVQNVVGLDINVIKMAQRKSWSDNRAIIMGDSAHAVTPFGGQGCNNTIYDSVALAYIINKYKEKYKINYVKQLLDSKTIVNEIFNELYNVRSEYATKAVNDSLALTKILAFPKQLQKFRNFLIKLAYKTGLISKKASKITIPRVGFDIVKEIKDNKM